MFEGYREIDVDQAKQMVEAGAEKVVVLDIRNPDEWYGETGHIEGALLITMDSLPMNLDKLEPHKDKEIVCVCYIGQRSAQVAQWLNEQGYKKTYNVDGGMMEWFDRGYPTVGNDTWDK